MRTEFYKLLLKYGAVIFLTAFCAYGAIIAQQRSNSYQLSTYLGVLGRNLSADLELNSETEILDAVETGIREKDKYFRILYTEDEFLQSLSALSIAAAKKYGVFFDPKTGVIKDVLRHSANYTKLNSNDVLLQVGEATIPSEFLRAFQATSSITVKVQTPTGVQELTLTSRVLHPIYTELNGTHATITFYFFKTELLTELTSFLRQNAGKITELTLDLTQCPGGKVKTLAASLGFLFPTGTPFFYEQRKAKRVYYLNNAQPILDLTKFDGPITVLKSARTASSAEIFAGVLNHLLFDKPNFKLVGETTYGKWTTIQFIKFLKGGMLHSLGRVHLPDGTTYEGKGI